MGNEKLSAKAVIEVLNGSRVSGVSTRRTCEPVFAVAKEKQLSTFATFQPSSAGIVVPAHAISGTLRSTPLASPACPSPYNHSQIPCTPAEIPELVRSESRRFATIERDWIRSSDGGSLISELLSPTSDGPPWHADQCHTRLTANRADITLPERAITELYLQLFRSTPFRLVFPIVDAVLFQDTIGAAYHPEGDSSVHVACVLAFLSIMSHMPWSPRSNGAFDGEACAKQADSLMGLASPGTSLVELQFYIMQCIQKLFSGELKAASLCHAVACRLLFMLGGHMYPQSQQQLGRTCVASDLDRRTKDHIRKLFWLCYTVDKIIALRTGEPPCIDDQQCDLTLPLAYADVLYQKGDFDAALPTALSLFPGDLRLSIIKSLSSRDDGHGFTPVMDSTQKMHIIMIHLDYYHLMATVHGYTSRKISRKVRDDADGVHASPGVSSSQILSVEASRASLYYLRAASHAMLGTTWGIIVFYPLNAILTIIGNVLLGPLQAKVEQDMKLLESTADLIKQIWTQRSIHIDHSDLVRVESFVSEVIRLGRSTIVAAGKGQNGLDHIGTEMLCGSV